MNKKNLLLVLVLAAAAVVAVYLSKSGKGDGDPSADETVVVRAGDGKGEAKPKANRRPKKIRPASEKKISENGPAKPDFTIDSEIDEAMSDEFKALYEALRLAFEAEDMAKVKALVKKLREMPEWPDGVPRKVKLAALEALTWFGAECLGDALQFLTDKDIEITEAALEAYEDMFMDLEIGDRALADIITQLAPFVHNTDALELFFEQMSEMRNSVKVQTALAIWDCGNKDALEVLKENLDSIFDDNDADYDITTREDIVKYGEDNPDDEDDEETYGPPSNADDEDTGGNSAGDDEDDESVTSSVEQYLKDNPDEDIVISISPDAQ